MMAWLPTYFSDTLSLDLTQAAQLSLLPPVAAIVASSVAGTGGDALISRNVPVAVVRKLAQCTAFLLPTLCLAGATWTEDPTLTVGEHLVCMPTLQGCTLTVREPLGCMPLCRIPP